MAAITASRTTPVDGGAHKQRLIAIICRFMFRGSVARILEHRLHPIHHAQCLGVAALQHRQQAARLPSRLTMLVCTAKPSWTCATSRM